ncbi:MAG: hypothetical protein ACRC3H_09230 [Lachnospiraceae bacterium]
MEPKHKTGLARCLEIASDKKGRVFLSALLSAKGFYCIASSLSLVIVS